MPIITLECGHLAKDQKAELTRGFTDLTHKVTGIAEQSIIVIVHENAPENIGVGGELLADRKK